MLVIFFLALAIFHGAPGYANAAEDQLLWQIGTLNTNDSEFALAHGNCAKFLEEFGRPENAFYVGLSHPQTDWPCVLPGPVDRWAGGDMMNTLPIGFVLNQISSTGQCCVHD